MKLIKDLPTIFDDFSEARKNGFLNAKNCKEKNIPLIGSYCTFMPQEIPLAMGAATVSLCSTSDETMSDAEKYLPRNLCPLIKSSFGFAITDKCPYFYFSDIVIGETTCDGKKKMYEQMQKFKDVYVMQLPNNPITEESKMMWKNEIIHLKEKLEEKFSVKITDEDVKNAVKLRNEERKALKNLYSAMKLDPPPITGMDLFKVLYGATFKFDKKQSIEDLKEAKNRIDEMVESKKVENKRKPRILLTGCPVGGATEKVISAIEDNGAYIVYYENCTGGKAVEELVDEENEDVYEALSEKYLKIGCSCLSPNPTRYEHLSRVIKEYKIDGVVDMVLTACHTYAIESFEIKDMVNKFGLPFIAVETDYSQSDIAQLNTRLGAFIEML